MSQQQAGTNEAAAETKPWHASYPEPLTAAASIAREEVRQLLISGTTNKSYILIDLRRNDYEGGTIRGSLNLPAQSLYTSIPTLYNLFHAAEVEKVIWYCGSSRGRGTRAAGWFADHIQRHGDGNMQSLVLLGGIKGWVAAGPDYVALMDEYNAEAWER